MEWTEVLCVTACFWCCGSMASVKSAVPNPPTNLTLAEILSDAIVVTWDADVTEKITLFEMIIRPLYDSPRFVTAHLDGSSRSYFVHRLYPETEYELFISAHNPDGMSNVSDVITFRTLEVTENIHPTIHPAEVIIIGALLISWFIAIAMFLKKWSRLRILQSAEPRYNHNPKNIETIKVVKRSTDSVIHKSYTKQLTKTMDARQKRRIERMNTMPNIKVNLPDIDSKPKNTSVSTEKDKQLKSVEDKTKTEKKEISTFEQLKRHKSKIFSRTITSPVLEVEEPHVSNV